MHLPYFILLFGLFASFLSMVEQNRWHALGFRPISIRLIQLITGLIIGTLVTLTLVGVNTLINDVEWIFVPITTAKRFVGVFLYQLGKASFIELIFRGILLIFLLKYLSKKWAIFLAAVLYMIYQSVPYVFDNFFWISSLLQTLRTFTFGLVMAYAFYQSESLLACIGIHVSWLYGHALFYSAVPSGRLLFMENNLLKHPGGNFPFYIDVLISAGYILLSAFLLYLGIRYLLHRPKKIIYIQV